MLEIDVRIASELRLEGNVRRSACPHVIVLIFFLSRRPHDPYRLRLMFESVRLLSSSQQDNLRVQITAISTFPSLLLFFRLLSLALEARTTLTDSKGTTTRQPQSPLLYKHRARELLLCLGSLRVAPKNSNSSVLLGDSGLLNIKCTSSRATLESSNRSVT